MTYNIIEKNVEISENFMRVTVQTFHKVSLHVSYERWSYRNATEYRFNSSSLPPGECEVFGYLEYRTNQFYLKKEIIEQFNSGTWDHKEI